MNCAISAIKHDIDYLVLEKGVLANSIFHFPANMTFFSTSQKLEIGDIPFISHTDKPTRREALEYYRRISEAYQIDIRFRKCVNSIYKEDGVFNITTAEETYTADYVIVCTGYYDIPRLLNIPGEGLPKVKHYYDEAHPYIGQKIVVIGGANSACDIALETWQKGSEVTMVVRKPELYQKVKYWILPNIENRIKEGSIKAYFNSQVSEITEKTVTIDSPEGTVTIENDYVLAMTGYMPDYPFLEKINIEFDEGEFRKPIHHPDTLESTIPGLYLAGVINSGLATSKLFIENTRDHGERIISHIVEK